MDNERERGKPITGRAFYVLERDADGKRSLAWDRGFSTSKEARLMARAMKAEPHFRDSNLLVGYWTGTEWDGVYEPVL